MLTFALLGCSGSSPAADRADQPKESPAKPAPAPTPAQPQPPGPPQTKGGADELHELEGQTRAAILERFGPPTREREFAMADCCDEFEIELYNTYPPDEGHDAVQIHEWTWDFDGYALTTWLHEQAGEWRVLETSRYSDDVEF